MTPSLTIVDAKTIYAARRAEVSQRLLVSDAQEARQELADRLACEREVRRG